VTANAYTFLPWLRAGISTHITADPGTAARASVDVKLRLTGEPLAGAVLSRDVVHAVQLYGPGDVVGVDPRAISRTEPRPWITNVEPNYLAHIEFYEEDFPWRYSPAPPDGGTKRLAPWLALVVLAVGRDADSAEFTESPANGGPLPFITVRDPATLPPPAQLGAWAHVHVNGTLDGPVATDTTSVALGNLGEVLRTNPDNACSRLVCPRHLLPDTAYQAFLVPAFETGRLAGLGLDPAVSPAALYSSWGPPYANRPAEGVLPFYHRWFFSTGAAGDFEFLVRLLQPRVPDEHVGRRDMDVHRSPGAGLPGITTPADIGGVLRLGGALQVPDRPVDVWDNWDHGLVDPSPPPPYPHPFQQALAALINLAEDYQHQTPAAVHANLAAAHPDLAAVPPAQVDPIITPPLYGRWHALTSRLLTDVHGNPIPAPANRNWVHRLNLDPRFRVAANFGAQVVQARQEEFMAAAWAQVGDVLAANARIRAAQLAREVGHVLQVKHIDQPTPAPAAPVSPSGKSLRLTAPAHSRVTAAASAGLAVAAAAGGGIVGGGVVGGGVVDGVFGLIEQVAVGFRVATSQVAAAPLSPAMRRITRPGSRLMRSLPFTAEQPPDALVPRMDAASGAVTAAAPKIVPSAVVTSGRLEDVLHPPLGVAPRAAGADPVDSLPSSPDFVLKSLGDPNTPTPGATDSAEATRYKGALRELYQGFDSAASVGKADPRLRLHVDDATTSMLAGLRADETVPKNVLGSVRLPDRLKPFADQFIEAMAYPVIDLPMYRSLLDLSVDVFVPNLNLIPPNSITLLANNREFIESYLVGLNHEMARELLWREYPTDQRGTPFRQFWDPTAALGNPGESQAARRERLYDIQPIHRWPTGGALGQNDNRQAAVPGQRQKDDLVLVIRGELLKKYPTTAIYAVRAEWPPGANGKPDLSQERVLATIPEDEHPSAALVRMPLYEAKVEPDVYLLGFDLDADEARGHPPDDAGWFFVIKERPGDPRFGVDVEVAANPPPVEVWNDLTWDAVDPHQHGFIEFDQDTHVALAAFDGSEDDPEKKQQRTEDDSLPLWYSGLSSADIAYILFQAPVLVAVHAQEMLPKWPI
jgi:hypothetical protein